MQLDVAMRTAGAIRQFTEESVPDEMVVRVLELARFAPSGGNAQPWRVILVQDPGIRRALRELSVLGWREYRAQLAAGARPFAPCPDGRWHGVPIELNGMEHVSAPMDFIDNLDRVPVMLVLCVRLTALALMDIELDRPSIVGGGSIYPFAQNILLAARAEGLGGVMTTFIIRRETYAAEQLRLPPDHAVAGLIALGFPRQRPTSLRRRDVQDFLTVDTFEGDFLRAMQP